MSTQNSNSIDARQILIAIAKHKGLYDESYTNFMVTPEELQPYLDLYTTSKVVEELQRIWKTAVDNNVAGPVKWEIEDRIKALKGVK